MTGKSYSKRDAEQLQAILKYCKDIGDFIDLYGSSETSFSDNIPLQYSCVFALMQIGEHVKRLSPELKDEHPEIDWKNAAGMRDFIAHSYMDINVSKVRSTILDKIPYLEEKCRSILDRSKK